MTAQIPPDRAHIGELLPAYVAGLLDADRARDAHEHLAACATCQLELAEWQSLKGATRQLFEETPLPSAQLMSRVWEEIEASEQPAAARPLSPLRALRRSWLIFRAQIPLIHKSTWVASALVCLFGLVLTLLMARHTPAQKNIAADVLVLFIVVVGASGSAFIAGSSVDPGFELTIATPTSMRFVMLCRMAIVLAYNLGLALLASAAFATVYGGSLWGFVQLWLCPLLFLSSLCLALSLFLGSALALLCAAMIELSQTFPPTFASHLVSIPLPVLDLSPSSPMLLIAALLLLAFATLCMPRQPRLAS